MFKLKGASSRRSTADLTRRVMEWRRNRGRVVGAAQWNGTGGRSGGIGGLLRSGLLVLTWLSSGLLDLTLWIAATSEETEERRVNQTHQEAQWEEEIPQMPLGPDLGPSEWQS